MNAHVPRLMAQTFPKSRIEPLYTCCVYPFVPGTGKGADETVPPEPRGEYAQSCVGRVRMFEYFSRKFATPGRLFRLNYADGQWEMGGVVQQATTTIKQHPHPP